MTSDNPNPSPADGEGLDHVMVGRPLDEMEKVHHGNTATWPHPPYPVYHPYFPHPFQMTPAVYGGGPTGHPAVLGYPTDYGFFAGAGPADSSDMHAASGAYPRNYKTVVCRHFLRGHCLRGITCGFRHFEEEAPQEPRRPKSSVNCRRWTQLGDCHLGDRCGFRHDENFCPISNDAPKTSQPAATYYPHLTNNS